MFKTRKLICHVIMVAMILALAVPVFADSTVTLTPREAANISISVDRTSNTHAETITSVSYFGLFSSAKVTLTLQESKGGSWVTATGVTPVTQSATKYNYASVYMVNDWNLTKGKLYRIKCTTKDTTNGITYTDTFYSSSF